MFVSMKHGGARPGSGRKKKKKGEKAIPITVSVPGKMVNELGKERARECAKKAITELYMKELARKINEKV